MTEKTKLRLNSITIIFLVVIFVFASFFLLYTQKSSLKKQQLIQEIYETSYQLALLRSEYFIYKSERPQEQSISSYESMTRLLDEAKPIFSKPTEKMLFEKIIDTSNSSKILFANLVNNVEQGGNETVRQELINQLSIKSQKCNTDILHLVELSRSDTQSTEMTFFTATIILGVIVIIITITSTILVNRIFQSIEQAKAKDDAILSSIGDGVAVADENGKIIYFNKNAENILGGIPNDQKPDTWQLDYGVFDPITFKPYPTEKMPLLLATQGKKVNKIKMYIKNTKIPKGMFISVTASPIFLSGKKIGAVAIFRDITKENEIDKSKTEFVSLASHQLRTPLTSVNWYTEMLLSGDAGSVNSEQKKYLEEIYKGNQRMVELVNALLNVSRLEFGTFVIEPEPTDISKLIQSVIDEQKSQISAKKIKMSFVFGKNIPIIQTDQKLLRIIVQNLLSNSVKYIPNEGQISLSLYGEKENIILKISDTGYGIPKTQEDKIFTKLFRADNVRQKDTDGTGLGLYIVKSIIEHSGGKVWFKSEENKGTTFYVSFPLEGMKKKNGTKKLN